MRGHVDSIQRGAGQAFGILPPENATGNYVKVVQRVPVKIVLDHVPAGLHPGPGHERRAHASRCADVGGRRAGMAAGRRSARLPASAIPGPSSPSSPSPPSWWCWTPPSPMSRWRHIAGSLSASYDEAAWVITSFLVANAIVIPDLAAGWPMCSGASPITCSRWRCSRCRRCSAGLSPNLPLLIVARILQGIGGGGLAPVEQSMMVDTFPPAKRGAAFAAYGVVVIVGPIFGPSLGGWITDNLFLALGVPDQCAHRHSVAGPGQPVRGRAGGAEEAVAKKLRERGLQDRLYRLLAGRAVSGLPGSDAGPRPARRLVFQRPDHHQLRHHAAAVAFSPSFPGS